MKKIGTFYFIFVILCSLLPCSDALEAKANTENTIQNIAHKKQDCNTENCSSMCLCTCCGQSVLIQTQIAFEVKVAALINEKKAFTPKFKLQQRAKNIWQPPKIIA